MSARHLASELCRRMQQRRLERLGEQLPPKSEGDPLYGLPREEQQTWIDLANVVLDMHLSATDRLRQLIYDWHVYGTLKSREWRDEMRRAVVVEMREQVEHLARQVEQ